MLDPRVTKLAELLVNHSLDLNPKDRLLIHAFDIPDAAIAEVVRVAQGKGAMVVLRLERNLARRQLMHGMTEANARMSPPIEKHEMEQMTAYLALRGTDNYAELSDVPSAIQTMWSREYTQPVVFGIRVPQDEVGGIAVAHARHGATSEHVDSCV